MSERTFYHCPFCGNLIEMVLASGQVPVCCGHPMKHLAPNTTDAAQEKHVPVASRLGNQLHVTVGSVAHPMSEEHFIGWIEIVIGDKSQRLMLHPGQSPEALFDVTDEAIRVYAYCNLHGLWQAEVAAVEEELVCSPEFPEGCQ